jgi:hypothetical protein
LALWTAKAADLALQENIVTPDAQVPPAPDTARHAAPFPVSTVRAREQLEATTDAQDHLVIFLEPEASDPEAIEIDQLVQ